MTEHAGANPAPPADAATRRGTFLPAAAPIRPRSIDEAGDLLMPIYAEPVIRHGATRSPGSLPSAGLLTLDIDGERTAATRLRRGGQIATAGMAAAVIAVIVSAFAPLPDGSARSAYDSSALADTFPQPIPTQKSQPLAAEGGRVSIDLRKADDPAARQHEAPNLFGIPLPSLPPFLQDVIPVTAPAVGGSGVGGSDEQPGGAGPSAPSGPESPTPPAMGDPSASPPPSDGATAPGATPVVRPGGGSGTPAGGAGSPTDPSPGRPSPSDPMPTAPGSPTIPGAPTQPPPSAPGQPTTPTPPRPSAPGEPTPPAPARPGPTQPVPTQPVPTQPEPTRPEPTRPEPNEPEPTHPPVTTPPPVSPPPATEPPATQPPATTAPLTVDASCRITGSLLGLVTSNECSVHLTGEPNADVHVFYGGLWWRDVRLDASGQAAPVARSADVLGLLGILDDLLVDGEFSATYR